jgi:hypothetical protein
MKIYPSFSVFVSYAFSFTIREQACRSACGSRLAAGVEAFP